MEFVQPIRDKKKIDSIKKILKSTNMRDYCLFTLGVNSALRVSDLLKLTWGDVLSPDGKLRNRVTIRETKTGKTKDFPLSDNAQKALREYMASLGPRDDLTLPLFPSRKGGGKKALQRAHAWQIINNAARAVGIEERIGTHTLRKSFAYHAHQQGVDIVMLQQLLNHHSPSTTLRYIGITQDDLDSVYLNVNL